MRTGRSGQQEENKDLLQKGQAQGTIRKNLKTRYRYDSILRTLKDLLLAGMREPAGTVARPES